MAAIARDMVVANTFGSAALLVIFLLGGFIIPKGRAYICLWRKKKNCLNCNPNVDIRSYFF